MWMKLLLVHDTIHVNSRYECICSCFFIKEHHRFFCFKSSHLRFFVLSLAVSQITLYKSYFDYSISHLFLSCLKEKGCTFISYERKSDLPEIYFLRIPFSSFSECTKLMYSWENYLSPEIFIKVPSNRTQRNEHLVLTPLRNAKDFFGWPFGETLYGERIHLTRILCDTDQNEHLSKCHQKPCSRMFSSTPSLS